MKVRSAVMNGLELAALLGVSRNRLYALLARGEILAEAILRSGTRYRFKRGEIERWLSIHEYNGTHNWRPTRSARRGRAKRNTHSSK